MTRRRVGLWLVGAFGGVGTTIFYAAAFCAVSLLFFIGPARGKPGSVWFGLSCLFLAAYAVLVLGFRLPGGAWVSSAGAAACFLIGTYLRARTRK